MKKDLLFIIVLCLPVFAAIFITACIGGHTGNAAGGEQAEVHDKERKVFVMPEIPVMITDETERLEYTTIHFWDNYNFQTVATPDSCFGTEQAVAVFVMNMHRLGREVAAKALQKMVARADTTTAAMKYFFDKMEYYLYHPLSPYMDDEKMIVVTDAVLKSRHADFGLMERAGFMRKSLEKNREGHGAADFRMTLPDGIIMNMYGLKSEYTLLFFYSPGCENCAYIREAMAHDERIAEMVDKGSLKVVALYTEGDFKLWKSSLKEFPAKWIKACDREMKIENNGMYLIKATPTLYLLDRNKRVLLKDAPLEKVLSVLFDE